MQGNKNYTIHIHKRLCWVCLWGMSRLKSQSSVSIQPYNPLDGAVKWWLYISRLRITNQSIECIVDNTKVCMVEGLFRQEAIEHQRHRLHGDVLLLPKISHTLILTALVVWVAVVLVWLFNSTYSRKETAFGWLEPPNGVIRVYPEYSGIIKTILVKEGDYVTKDQPLIIINGDRILASGDNLETKLLNEYETQRELLNEQLIRAKSIYTFRTKDTQQRIAAAQGELKMLNQQITILNQRHELIKNQLERQKALRALGHISSSEYDSAINQELAIQSEKQGLIRSQIIQNNLIDQLQTELGTLPEEHNNQNDQLRERLSSIAQQIAQLSGQRSQIIKAPKDGLVNNLQAIEGQLAQLGANAPLMTLIPADGTLTAHLLVPVRAAGFVEPNQQINIRYDAFPYEKFGLYTGEIKTVSKTLLLPYELLKAPVPIQEPVYRITATLKESSVNAYGKEFPLKPGMTLSADIQLSERTLMQWLLEPLYSLQGRL